AGAFIAIVDAFTQSQIAGSIQFSPALTLGIVLMDGTGALLAWVASEGRWIKGAKLDRIFRRVDSNKIPLDSIRQEKMQAASADADIKADSENLDRMERRLKRIIDERMNKALRDWERSNRRNREARSFGSDDLIH